MTIATFGLAVSQRADDVDDALDRIGAIERDHADVAGFWVADNPLGTAGLLDPLAMLAFLAARTRRARLGAAVIVAPLHSPLTLAKAAASIDRLAHGRLVLGLGSGRPEHHRAGGAPASWAAWYDELVTCTTALLRGEQVTSTTGSWSLDGAAIAPLPTQAQLPIWLSGHAPAAIDRAARLADGWIGSGFSPLAAFATDVERFRLACDAAGRQRSDVTVAKRVYLHVPDACPSGRRDLDPWSRSLFGAAGLGAEVVVQGTPAECAEAIDAVIAAGADHVIVDPAYHDHSHVEAILTDVLPRTRGGTL